MLRVGQWKALFGLLSAATVVAPAAGLGYLGVTSNLAERDRARQSFLSLNQKEARFIAATVDDEAERALDAVAQLFAESAGGRLPSPDEVRATRGALPLVEYVFYIDASGELRWPPPHAVPGLADRTARAPARRARAAPAGPERDFEDYVTTLRLERQRARALDDARSAEVGCGGRAGGDATCTPTPQSTAEARRAYAALARGDGDSAAQALLGLARLDLLAGRSADARRRYAILRGRFGALSDAEGIPYALLADLGELRASGEAGRALALYRGLLDAAYPAPSAALVAFTATARAAIDPARLDGDGPAEVARLDARRDESRRFAAIAAGMAGEVADLARTAGAEPQARRAAGRGGRMFIYRRHLDGGVVGLAASEAALRGVAQAALEGELGNLPAGTRVVLDAAAKVVPDAPGLLAAQGLRLFPFLAVSLWGDDRAADRAVRAQLWRYLGLVGGLIALMVVGVIATYRGAARERELGQLKSDFVSTVSHELKTPLTSIRMFGEMLREGVAGDDTDRQRRYHDVIVRESERLGRLIGNVLDFSQIERGARRYDRRPIAVAALAAEAVETFQRLADGEGHRVSLVVADGAADAFVDADREALVQSLLNLLSNASKYGGKDHAVTVEVSARPSGSVSVAVTDRGPGIAPRDLRRIFREFYRAPEARRSGVEGTGLGLVLVKRHTEAHGGQVTVTSTVGKGSTFTIVLPRSRGEEGTA